jgi:hypothetical protein
MALDLGKLIGTVTKIANDPNMKKAVTGAKNAVTKAQKNNTKPAAQASAVASAPTPELKLSAEKVILQLAESSNPLSLRQIVSQTSLELDEADVAVKNLIAKGVATEQVGPDGKTIYDFS